MEKSVGEETFASKIRDTFAMEAKEITTYSPLTLAYIGDSVFELIIRTLLVTKGNTRVAKLHDEAIRYVSAGAQRNLYRMIEPLLNEEERAVFRRGRNAKPHSVAKNATVSEYSHATGFEAVCGYLYLTGQEERLLYLIETGIREQNNQEVKP